MIDMVSSNNAFANNSMIFKTIDSSVDNTRKTLALFNKDWNTYKTNWQQGFSQDGVTGGIKSIFQSSNSNSVISKDQLQILRNWNNAVAHGCTNQETFNRIIKDADSNIKLYFSGLNKGKGSVEGLKNAQNVAKQSTIGLTLAQTALNAAISLGFTAAIMLAVKGLDKLINSAKRASEAADEAFSNTTEKVQKNEDEAKSLDELISKYKELKESENLDVDGRKEIKEIQNDIADLVGVQASNLDLVNGKLDEQVKKLNKITAKRAKMAYETATTNYNNSKKANENAAGDDSFLFADGLVYAGKREKKAEEILKKAGFGNSLQFTGFFGNTLSVTDYFDNNMNELKGAQEKSDYLQSMIDVLEQNGQRATDLYAGLISQRDKYLQYIDNQQDAANSLVNSWISYSQFSNDELSKINVDSLDSFKEYRQKMIDEAKNDESIGEMLADGTLSNKDLENAVNDFMATSTKFSTWYEQWIDDVQSSTSNIETPLSFTNSISQIQDLSQGLDQLDKIYLDVKNKEDFDWSSILNNDNFEKQFGNMENVTETYKSKYEEFIQTVSNSPSDIKACQSAFDNLATAYIYNSGALQNVTNETKNATIAMLEQMGIINADEIVTASLAAQELYLKLNMDDSTVSIYEQITGLLEHSDASAEAKAELFNLVLQEQEFANTDLGVTDKILQLEQLGLAFGVTADAAHSSARAMDAIRFAGMAAGKEAAEQTKEGIYEEYSDWYYSQIAQKYGNLSAKFKSHTPSNKKKGKGGSKGSGSSKQEYKETVDWVEKTITLLTDKIALLNAKLDNTTSYKNQIKYIKKLAEAQEKLIQVYDKAQSVRSKTYFSALKKLSKSDRKKVESGAYTIENFKWTKSSDSKKMAKNEKRYQNIKDALEARDALSKARQDFVNSKSELKKLASDLADKTWEKATNSLEKYNHQMDLLEKKLLNTTSFKSKNKLLAKQLDLEQKILSAKEKALSVEKQEANSIGNKIKKGYKKLSSSKKEKIDKSLKSDTKIDIASLGVDPSSSLYQLMIQYNAYIDKLIEETANLEVDKQETISSINEKAQSIVDNVWDEAMTKVESLSNEIESLDKVLANTDGFKERNKILEEMIRLTEKSIQTAKQGVQDEKKKTVAYDKNIKNELAKDKKRKKKKISSKDTNVIETAIKSGKKINVKELSSVKVDSDLYKNIIQHNKSIDATKEKRKIYQDNKQDGISDINQRILDKYSSIQDYYERMSNKIQSDVDKLNGLISLSEAKGQVTSQAYYQKLQGFEKNKTKDLVKEKKDLEKQLESDIKLGRIEIYSSKWYEAIATIQDCEKAILDSELAIEEFNNSIRELDWSKFDQLISKLEEISKESNFLIGLFDKDNMFDDNGVINLDGLTAQGLYAQNHNVYMEESKKYAEEIKKIDESLAKDPYNKKLLEHREELLSAQQQAITNAKSEKDSIISLVEEGYKKKVDALSELVSKQQELLDKEKELHDYEKSIRNKSDNITLLEKQIQALSLSTDRADIAKRLQLEEELKNSKEDLEEEQYQHSISSQKDALSNALNDYKEQIEDYLKDRDKVFEDALSEVNNYHSSILTNIKNKAQSVGYEISDSLIHVWNNTKPVSNYTNTVVDSMNGVSSAIDNVNSKLKEMYEYYGKIAKKNINTTFKDSNSLTTSAQIRDILGEASGKNGANNKGTSELNKYLASLGYGYLDQDGMVKLAKALGINGMDSIEGIRENGGTSVIVEELKKYISSNKNTVSELEKHGKVSASNVKKTMDLIHGASTYTDKRDKLSDLNKYIYDNYDKKYLTKSQMVKLAKYLGETSVKDTSDLTDKAKKNLLTKLKAASFSKGGIVELVKQTGEDGISLVRRGEGILSQEQVKLLQKSIPIMNHVTQQLDINKNLVPVQRDVSNIVKITSPLVEVNGNLDNVTKRELENAIKNVPNMLVSQMNKYGSRGGNLRR